MRSNRLQIGLSILLLFAPVAIYGQSPTSQEKLRHQRAIQEIEGVIVDTGKLDDPLMLVSIKSRAANLVWRYDRKRAEMLFLNLWSYIDQQGSEYFDQDEARTVLLKNLYPINSTMAGTLLKELSARQKTESTLRAQATGNDPGQRRMANIAAGLADQDSALAARLLSQSLSMGVTPTALSVLARLRERNPILANYLVSQSLEQLRIRPTIVALTSLHLLTAYLFPAEPYVIDSPEAAGTDDRLRLQYFSTAYEILKASLEETDALLTKDKQYTESDLRFRAIYQGQIALILAALAPRFGSQFVEELNALARRLSGSMPANIASLSNYVVARVRGEQNSTEDPDIAITVAIANGDFVEARRLIDKIDNEEKKKAFTQVLAKAEFNTRLAESNLSEALSVARRIENVNLRIMLFLQVARAASRKDDASFLRVALNEARSALSNTEMDGMRARLLLSFASEVSTLSESDAIDVLHQAVVLINSLSKSSSDSNSPGDFRSAPPLSVLNDPRSLVDSSEVQRAFSSVARVDFDGTLLAAARINPTPVQLMAKLATSEIAITTREKKPQTIPERKTLPVAQPKRQS